MPDPLSPSTTQSQTAAGTAPPRWGPSVLSLAFVGLGMALFPLWLGVLSRADGLSAGLLALLEVVIRWASAGGFALLYVASALGLGRWLADRLLPGSESWTVRAGVGVATLLTVSSLLAWGGLLSPAGRAGTLAIALAWVVLVPGWLLLLLHLRTALPARAWWLPSVDGASDGKLRAGALATGMLACGLMLAAGASTPGFLWASEFGGFDALSYHLPLPQEWLREGALRTLEHSVYSALPSALSAGVMHQTLLMPGALAPQAWAGGLQANDGAGLLAAQMLHALLGVLACLGCGGFARAVARWGGADQPTADLAGAGAFAVAAIVPWTTVVGSLAYNELGVVLMVAACGRALLHTDAGLLRRGLLCGALAGAACMIKPNALFALLALGICGAFWLREEREGTRGRIVLAGSLAAALGLAMLTPWLARNAMATGNPVFPFAPAIFARADGSMGHWNAEQVDRFRNYHRFVTQRAARSSLKALGQRLRYAIPAQSTRPAFTRPDGTTEPARGHTGLLHPQWLGLTLASPILGVVALVARGRGARWNDALAGLLFAFVTGVVLWMLATHIQSRFLVPLLPVVASLAGLGWCVLASQGPTSAGTRATLPLVLAGIALPALLCIKLVLLPGQAVRSAREGSGPSPIAGLLAQPNLMLGEPAALARLGLASDARDTNLGPDQTLNALGPDARVLLVGEAKTAYLRRPVRWASVWDTSPITTITASAPTDPSKWSGLLRGAGVTHVLIHFAELDRYRTSGYLDPQLDPALLERFARQHATVLRTWDTGQVLLEVP